MQQTHCHLQRNNSVSICPIVWSFDKTSMKDVPFQLRQPSIDDAIRMCYFEKVLFTLERILYSFNSLIELIANGYSNYTIYQRGMEVKFSGFEFFHLVIDYATNKTTNKWYIKRALCLCKMFNKPLINTFDCSCNISNLILKLLYIISRTSNELKCKKCKTTI